MVYKIYLYVSLLFLNNVIIIKSLLSRFWLFLFLIFFIHFGFHAS